MSDSSREHPDQQQLVDFGHGKLGPDQTSEIEEHLDRCVVCNETLLNLADDTFTGLVRSLPEPGKVPLVENPADKSPTDTEHDAHGDSSRAGNELTDGAVASDEVSHAATMLVQSGSMIEPSELPAQLQEHPRYRIVERIGSGGMGDVYRAEHRLMNRSVALKLINSQLIKHPQAVERFRREVQAAARLTHPNIVTAFDAEQAGDVHFLAMEFVEGTDLATVVQHRGALPVAEACDCIRQAADGLQHAHEKGMVHRDIKPHNLMLSPSGQVRILDFGLAGFATESAMMEVDLGVGTEGDTTPLHLTTFGSVMGTPNYIAPEQAKDAHSADIRADIYSLGCTLYCLLSGTPPHEADSVVEKLKAHAEREPLAIESVQVDVPAELAEVVRRMMAKDPAERFQTPAEVADALAPFVDQHRTDGGGDSSSTSGIGRAAPGNPLPITFALCFAGTLSVLAFALAVVLFLAAEWVTGIPHALLSWLKFGGLASLPVGAAVLFMANRSEKKNSHASAVKAGLLNLLPANPFVVVLLPLTVWTLLRLRNPSARVMYATCPAVDREEDKRRWPIVITTVACLLIAIYSGTFFIIQLGQTTLRFEIDDPMLAVRFGDEEISIDNDGDTIHIKPGEEQRFVVTQDGLEIETDSMTLRKGDKVILRVAIVDGKLLVDAEGARVNRMPGTRTSDGDAAETDGDRQRIQGRWKLLSTTDNGQKVSDQESLDRFMTFTGDGFTGPQRKQPLPGKFTLDATTDPKQIDLHFPSGPDSFIHIQGIYRLQGDRLTIFQATDWTASKRPTDFTTKPGDKRSLMVFEHVPDSKILQGTWDTVALEMAGQAAPESAFQGKQFVIEGGRISRFGKLDELREFQLNSTANPKQIDIGDSVEGQFSKGIYELNGDTLRLSMSQQTDQPRPTDFDTAGTRFLCFTLQRAEPAKPVAERTNLPLVANAAWQPEYGTGPIKPGVNLVNDPSLENTAPGEQFPRTWGNGNLIPIDAWRFEVVEGGRTGSRAWMIEGDGSAATVPTNRPPVDRSFRYAARAWVNVESGMARLGLLYFDRNYRYIDGRSSSTTTVSRGWHQLTMIDDFENHPEAAYVSLAFVMVGPGKAVFDDVELIAFDVNNLPESFEAKYASPEHDPALFDRWAGRWELAAEFNGADGRVRTVKGAADVTKILDDKFLLWHSISDTGDDEYLSLTGFDPHIGAYRNWGFDSRGAVREQVGKWDAETGTITFHMQPTETGNTAVSTDQFVSTDRMESVLLDRNSEGQAVGEMRVTWTRKSATSDKEITLSSGPAAEPKELAVLQKLAGNWKIESTYKPSVWSPDGKTETVSNRAEWVVGGRLLLFRSWNEQQQLQSVGTMNWDPIEKSFHYRHFAPDVYGGQWRITWDESSKGFHWRAVDMPPGWIGTGFNRWIDDDSFDDQAMIKDEQGRVLMDSQHKKTREKQ